MLFTIKEMNESNIIPIKIVDVPLFKGRVHRNLLEIEVNIFVYQESCICKTKDGFLRLILN